MCSVAVYEQFVLRRPVCDRGCINRRLMLLVPLGRLRCSARHLTTSANILQNKPSKLRRQKLRQASSRGARTVYQPHLKKPWASKEQLPYARQDRSSSQDFPSREDGDTTRSLLEELFPGEASRERGIDHKPKLARDIPYRPIGVTFVTEEGEADGSFAEDQEAKRGWHTRQREGPWRYQDSTVLVLSNAGKHLIYEDFRSALPTGQHLEGWTLGKEGMKGKALDIKCWMNGVAKLCK